LTNDNNRFLLFLSITNLGGQTALSYQSPMALLFVSHYHDHFAGQNMFHEVLVSAFTQSLQEKGEDVLEILCRHAWFALELIVKSMSLVLHYNNTISNPERTVWFTTEYTKVKKLILIIHFNLKRKIIINICDFSFLENGSISGSFVRPDY
jgi:hypothetical protein